jgi:hypothetical protein
MKRSAIRALARNPDFATLHAATIHATNFSPTEVRARSMMWMYRSVLFVCSVIVFTQFAAHAETAAAPLPDFAPGQEWSIKSASSPTAKLVVGRVEAWGDKTVVHVSILDVQIPEGTPGAGAPTSIGHMPFEKSALAASVGQLVASGVSPPASFEAGYQSWHSAKGGIFTISAPQAIEFMFAARSRSRR